MCALKGMLFMLLVKTLDAAISLSPMCQYLKKIKMKANLLLSIVALFTFVSFRHPSLEILPMTVCSIKLYLLSIRIYFSLLFSS